MRIATGINALAMTWYLMLVAFPRQFSSKLRFPLCGPSGRPAPTQKLPGHSRGVFILLLFVDRQVIGEVFLLQLDDLTA